MFDTDIPPAYTFDDVLMIPCASEVLPSEVSLATRLTDSISLKAPVVCATMDTVTEHQTAIAMAREGGIGIIHKNLPMESQVIEVARVKNAEAWIIHPPTVTEERA